jgi:hypothetical protein
VLISALGPKGLAITREIADGLFSVNNQSARPTTPTNSPGPPSASTAPSSRTRSHRTPHAYVPPPAPDTPWPTTRHTNSAAHTATRRPRLAESDHRPARARTPPRRTRPAPGRTQPRTKPRGPPAAGKRSPPPQSQDHPHTSPNNSPATPTRASPKSSTNPPTLTWASSNASSQSPNQHHHRADTPADGRAPVPRWSSCRHFRRAGASGPQFCRELSSGPASGAGWPAG